MESKPKIVKIFTISAASFPTSRVSFGPSLFGRTNQTISIDRIPSASANSLLSPCACAFKRATRM